MVFKAFIAFVIAGIVMALLVPAIHARGGSLQGWMVWAVLAASLTISVGPELWRRWRTRQS